MAIIVNLDVVMAKRKISSTELSQKLGITMANLSILKNNKAKAVRFTTLNELCKNANKNLKLIFLPPYSPNLNPIEKYWATLKKNLKKILTSTTD